MLDSAIYLINHCSQDEYEENHSIILWIDLSVGWHYSLFEQPEEHITTFLSKLLSLEASPGQHIWAPQVQGSHHHAP